MISSRGYGSNGVVISEMSFFLSFIHAAHVFDKMLTWILININIMGSDAKVNQVLKSGAVRKHELLIPNAVAVAYGFSFIIAWQLRVHELYFSFVMISSRGYGSNGVVISAHVFDKMLTWILININIMGSDAKVNQEFQDLKTTLQQQQEDVTTSLKNLRWLIKTRADALLYLRTTLGEECCDITQVAGTYGTPTRCA
ncbi:pyruvate dehydrogenase (acetyl-transferring) [Trifolium repens]|nr:pyruvate dehydrogenase (acetyl-transferring) [Trifolium repens]